MFSTMKLGCKPPRHDPRTLKLAKYLAPSAVPAPPESTEWRKAVKSWPMHLNDQIGCCVVTASAHMLRTWGAVNGSPPDIRDEQILAEYEALSGYDPATGANDNGVAIIDALNRWRKLGICGNRLGAYAEVTIHDHQEVAAAIWLFGGIDTGVQLPLAWQNTEVWSTPSRRFRPRRRWAWQPGSWGGHCVTVVDFDEQFLYAASWGQIVRITWDAWDAYFIEAYACLDSLWVDGTKPAPNRFDAAALQADLLAIGAN